MAIVNVGHFYDVSKVTVNDLVKSPTRVPNLIKSLVRDNDISPWMLREGPTAAGGAVVYDETPIPLYASDDGEIVAEFGEIPMASAPMRTSITRSTTKRGLGLMISKEMQTRNDMGRVQDEITMVRNRLVRTRERVFFDAIFAASTNVIPAGNATGGWLSGTTSIVADLADAMYEIAQEQPAGAIEEERLGYSANTLIIHPSYQFSLIDNTEINNIFAGSPLADEQLRYKGKLPKKFMNLDILMSWSCPFTTAIVCQRKAMGFISTEWPLSGSPMRYDEDTQSWRTNFSYRDLVAIDNPKAVCLIQNIDDGVA